MPAQANSSQDFISKNPSQKIELVERLKFQALAMKKKKNSRFLNRTRKCKKSVE
jgi:hypothetical protein